MSTTLRLGSNPTALVRVLTNMEKSGLIMCNPDLQDHSNKIVSLSDRGRDVTVVLSEQIRMQEAVGFATFDDDELRQFLHLLRKLHINIKDMNE